MFDPTGYENVLYTMIFVPIAIILFICFLVSMLVVLNRKRCVSLLWVEHSNYSITFKCGNTVSSSIKYIGEKNKTQRRVS